MSHPYPKLSALIDATDRTEDYLERHEGVPGWKQWERDTRRAINADLQRIRVMEAVWDHLCKGAAIPEGLDPREVESLKAEMAAYLARA